MASGAGNLWSEIFATEEGNHSNSGGCRQTVKSPEPQIAVVYRRQHRQDHVVERRQSNSSLTTENLLSFAPLKRVSWNRSLSTRGRTSIAVAACADLQSQQKKSKRNRRPPLPRGKNVQLPNYDKEIAYFQEVDSFELLEESPSPQKSGSWIMGVQTDKMPIPHLSSVLQKWLIAQRRKRSCGTASSLTGILETPAMFKDSLGLETLGETSPLSHSGFCSIQGRKSSDSVGEDMPRKCSSHTRSKEFHVMCEESCEDIEASVCKLSLTSRNASSDVQNWDPFSALLNACGQSAPSTFPDVLKTYCDPKTITKVGEGTFGEAFRVGETVCKIVPFDGYFKVNGEVQKRSEELLEEVMLSSTLNHLRSHDDLVSNACNSFIQTIGLRVCQGAYDAALLEAWEDWDRKHGSENDHPKEFPENQCYVVFVQEHGGKDLESFVLLNFDEARSLLVQVTLALAVAEAAFEFEHRDLHWGNILLSRKGSETLSFTLEGRKMFVRTYGLSISIIDFTLSRLKTGDDIMFLDLSSDPELFEGPKGDIQFDTYRKMKAVTDECWEGSFPRTNVLWLQYLVDILLTKKKCERTIKDARDLRSLKKRLNSYNSAKEAVADPFFSNLFVNDKP